MTHSPKTDDSPLRRFKIFWASLFLFAAFGLATLLFIPWLTGEKDTPDADAKRRLDIRDELLTAQEASTPKTRDIFTSFSRKLLPPPEPSDKAASPPPTPPAGNPPSPEAPASPPSPEISK